MPRKKKLKDEEYCVIEPVFPKDAFIIVAILFNTKEQNITGILPLSTVFTAPEEVKVTLLDIVKNSKDQNFTLLTECMLIPIKLHALHSLKKEYWANPSIHYDTWDRIKQFLPVVNNPTLYHLLVTPSYIEEKQNPILQAALPLLNPNDTELIEKFMLTTDLPVDERAKSAAIYSLGKPMRFNWETKEVNSAQEEDTKDTRN